MDHDKGEATSSKNLHSADHIIPYARKIFDSVEDVWNCWLKYGKEVGFGVRKETRHQSKKDGIVTNVKYVCCKEGRRKTDSRRMNSRHRWETRSGCQARLVVAYDRELRKYKVKQFVEEHNHDLEQRETIHMLRSHRSLTESHKCAISLATHAGLTPTEAHGLMVIESGGRENLGYTLEDHKTFLRTKR